MLNQKGKKTHKQMLHTIFDEIVMWIIWWWQEQWQWMSDSLKDLLGLCGGLGHFYSTKAELCLQQTYQESELCPLVSVEEEGERRMWVKHPSRTTPLTPYMTLRGCWAAPSAADWHTELPQVLHTDCGQALQCLHHLHLYCCYCGHVIFNIIIYRYSDL